MKFIREIPEIDQQIEGIKKNIWSYPAGKRERYKAKLRDNFKCVFCGKRKISNQIHHINPRRFGGKDESDNYVTICIACHPLLERYISHATFNGSIIDRIIKKAKRTWIIWMS